jgi:thiopeptide-type bacteriocin biosynthesis protein
MSWVPAPGFFLRTPLLPFDEWRTFAEGLRAPAAKDAELAGALTADRERARSWLRSLVARPEVREALFVASPSLDESLDVWLQAPDSDRGIKVERTLLRYLGRMCGRATPFGLFAGCAQGSFGSSTRLELRARDRNRRHTRLDIDYLFALCQALCGEPDLRERLRYRPNGSLYRAAGRLRYLEGSITGKDRAYHLVAVEPTEYIDAALELAREGAGRAELAAALAAQAEVELGEAREFVDELISSQLLVPDLQVRVTGPEPIHALIAQLESHPAARALAAVRDGLSEIDAQPVGVPPQRYREVAAHLRPLPAQAELARLFQVDMLTSGDGLSLGPKVAAELQRAVGLLHRTTPPVDMLRDFRKDFVARYEAAEVPLVEVLDEESGIGFLRSNAPTAETSPLLEGLAFPNPDRGVDITWATREQRLLAKLTDAAAHNRREIVLDDADVDMLTAPQLPPLPDSFSAIASIVAESAAAIDEGRFLVRLVSISGPSSVNLIGRFCHCAPELEARVREEIGVEERLRPDAIYAEVVHLPEGRTGNLVLRPVLRAWEIPFLGASGAPGDQQIPIHDLLVSVVRDRIVLRSRRLGREVIPRLSSAHHYSSPLNLGIYRFLCMLQMQHVAVALTWNWGVFDSAPFLPRVVCGRTVLALARWRLDAKRLQALDGDAAARWWAVQELRHELGLPRFVGVEYADQRLPIDLDHVLSVDTFVQWAKERDEAVLTELLFDQLPVHGPEGRFVHDLIVPFRRAEAPASVEVLPAGTAEPAIERRVVPGGDWLYVKLYAGAATVDRLLRELVAPLVREGKASGAIEDWFFIRYADPDWHLRLRIRGETARLRDEIEPALWPRVRELIASGVLWKAQLDTYHREVERYGGPIGMRLCEQIFAADSDAVLAILEALEDGAGGDARWQLALRGIDALLDDVGLDLDGKLELLRELRAGFGREFAVDASFEKQLGDRFRKQRSALEVLLHAGEDHPLWPGLAALARRSARLAPIGVELRKADADGRLRTPLPALAGSLVHMHANRMLRAAARANELVLYDFLTRLYEGRRARRRRGM